ncbi:MAG: type I-B CRISPR-associated protein Cas8b1/Cst1 [Candidatus Cloacimonetes bacterium]|nr:type I-B CRISPR-associated protein Cas8b1/Cst1 [Candidatus Cloacimonadota bacterium]
MEEQRKVIITGDPFVDTGGMVLECLMETFPEKSIDQLIDFAADVFVFKWQSKIDALQLNSEITHNSRRNSTKAVAAVKETFRSFEIKGEKGFCRICGKNDILFLSGRERFCLSGSGALVNFHHSHQGGLMLCRDCVTKLFFLPFGVVQMSGKIAFCYTNNMVVREYWKEKTVKENLNKIGRNSSDEILRWEWSNPRNALFKIADEVYVSSVRKRTNNINVNIQLYHFTNFGASPECELHILPARVFSFLSRVLKDYRKEWNRLLHRNFHITGAKWDDSEEIWKKKDVALEADSFRNNKNTIIEKLLRDESISKHIYLFYRNKFRRNENDFDTLMAVYYMTEVQGMRQDQIDLIKRLGTSIIQLAKQEDSVKKYLVMIEGASKAYQLRGTLLKLIKKNYLNGGSDPLLTLEEYVNYLFPDGQFWGEVRDLLLIFIYEVLHKENISIPDVESIALEEPEEMRNEV